MTPIQMCESVRALQAQGHSLREISRLLHISRNTVRRITFAASIRDDDHSSARKTECRLAWIPPRACDS